MIGSRLAHYQITAKLGEGGMGLAYRAGHEAAAGPDALAYSLALLVDWAW